MEQRGKCLCISPRLASLKSTSQFDVLRAPRERENSWVVITFGQVYLHLTGRRAKIQSGRIFFSLCLWEWFTDDVECPSGHRATKRRREKRRNINKFSSVKQEYSFFFSCRLFWFLIAVSGDISIELIDMVGVFSCSFLEAIKLLLKARRLVGWTQRKRNWN